LLVDCDPLFTAHVPERLAAGVGVIRLPAPEPQPQRNMQSGSSARSAASYWTA
jgi:hypothetical protein